MNMNMNMKGSRDHPSEPYVAWVVVAICVREVMPWLIPDGLSLWSLPLSPLVSPAVSLTRSSEKHPPQKMLPIFPNTISPCSLGSPSLHKTYEYVTIALYPTVGNTAWPYQHLLQLEISLLVLRPPMKESIYIISHPQAHVYQDLNGRFWPCHLCKILSVFCIQI